jgi:hypothetical protein
VSIASAIGRIIVASILVEARGVVRRFVRSLRKKPVPLPPSDAAHQQAQIRSATRQRSANDVILPPPPKK